MKYLEERYSASFYGYCNGDLLLDSSLIPLLRYIQNQMHSHHLLQKVHYVLNSIFGLPSRSTYECIRTFPRNDIDSRGK